jgi:hypothetical protein
MATLHMYYEVDNEGVLKPETPTFLLRASAFLVTNLV